MDLGTEGQRTNASKEDNDSVHIHGYCAAPLGKQILMATTSTVDKGNVNHK